MRQPPMLDAKNRHRAPFRKDQGSCRRVATHSTLLYVHLFVVTAYVGVF